ncbi:hypothetical protein ACFL3M_03380 [Patescibacteria group bacterium]
MTKEPIHPDELLKTIKELEAVVSDAIPQLLQQKIITAFENRGWALYSMNTSNAIVLNDSEPGEVKRLRLIVEGGRAKEHLETGEQYCLLPLHEMDSDWEIISLLLTKMLEKNRGPYFIDLQESGIGVEPIAVLFVNYIIITPPAVELIFNTDMSWSYHPFKSNVVNINIDQIDIALKTHMQMSLRDVT